MGGRERAKESSMETALEAHNCQVYGSFFCYRKEWWVSEQVIVFEPFEKKCMAVNMEGEKMRDIRRVELGFTKQ